MLRLAVGCVATTLFTTASVAWGQAAPQPAPAGTATAQPPAPATPPPGSRPPPEFYVEPSAPPAQAQPAQPPPATQPAQPPAAGSQPAYEPPPPGYGYPQPGVYEPPPPPLPRHIAPKYSFWVGARLGWFVPFGDAWARCAERDTDGNCNFDFVPLSDFVSSGPMFEIDVGARIGRNYNLFLLWERTELGSGSLQDSPNGALDGGDTDFFAIALRASSDADTVGFVTEIAIGARRLRAKWENGAELRMTEAPFETRLGLGADIRLSPALSLSPLVTLGVGAFHDLEFVAPDGTSSSAMGDDDEIAGHGWITLQIGGHFDVAGSG